MSSVDTLIRQDSFSQLRLRSSPAPALAHGQVRVAVDLYSLSANNVTYATWGERMGYWRFFPSGEAGWGIVPVWGFARVTESQHDELPVGERLYGFLPMASHAVLTPARVSAQRLMDASPHRADLAPAYNAYFRCATDPLYTAGSEAVQALLRPLFITSWLIDDYLDDNHFFGAPHGGEATVLLSSASSKTAYGIAFCLSQRPGVRVIGLTSPRNQAFCQQLGCYDHVLGDDALGSLPADTPAVFVDLAGNPALLAAVHQHLPLLRHSMAVGFTHAGAQALAAPSALPGPSVELFFAPNQIKKRSTEWGTDGFAQRMAQAWHAFRARVSAPAHPWLQVHPHHGTDAACAVWPALLSGHADPQIGHVISQA